MRSASHRRSVFFMAMLAVFAPASACTSGPAAFHSPSQGGGGAGATSSGGAGGSGKDEQPNRRQPFKVAHVHRHPWSSCRPLPRTASERPAMTASSALLGSDARFHRCSCSGRRGVRPPAPCPRRRGPPEAASRARAGRFWTTRARASLSAIPLATVAARAVSLAKPSL